MLRPRQRGEIEFIPANRRKSAREPDRTNDTRACVHSAYRVYITPPSPWRQTTFLSGQAIAAPVATGMLCPIAPPVSARCRKALATRRHPTGFGHACYGFRPSERDAFLSTEYISRIAPHRRSKGRQGSRHFELKFALVARVDRVIQSWGKMSAGRYCCKSRFWVMNEIS